ncbi:MAG: hypothetical protein IJC25_02390, partial [Clostridia bacterium]|nr:hypothetical protein [Clostridia bacterium]
EGYCMYRNLVVHILQLFCKPVGRDYVLPRQGGLQRLIWPVESMPTFEALDTIGDFDDYVEAVLSLYFDTLQVKEGENKGEITNFGENWASVTGACIYSLCVHILKRNKPELFERYADAAYDAFRWIEKTRATTAGSDTLFNGIFPPMRGCDWAHIFQSWTKTDVLHLDTYRAMIECFAHYNDPRTDEIRAAYADYHAAVKRIFATFEERYADRDEIKITADPSGNDDDLPNYPLINDEAYLLVEKVNSRPDSMQKIETYLRRRHVFKNGLVGRMRDQSLGFLDNKIYYTSIGEYFWYRLWVENGEFEKAHESLLAVLKYSTTPQHYMLERFLPENIYYVPWSPNGSANGRTILMLYDWLVERGNKL